MVLPTRLMMLVELEPATAKPYVWETLKRHEGNITRAAAELKISGKSLWRILYKLDLYHDLVREWPARRAMRVTGTTPREVSRAGESAARVAKKAAKKRTATERKKKP